jgi:hypothetical protein
MDDYPLVDGNSSKRFRIEAQFPIWFDRRTQNVRFVTHGTTSPDLAGESRRLKSVIFPV